MEDIADYEMSLRLREAGFDELCCYKWAAEPDGVPMLMGAMGAWFRNSECVGRDAAAPNLYHVHTWLREKRHISVRVNYLPFGGRWFADWLNLESMEYDDSDAKFATYEEALADGIDVVLKMIKEGE